MALTHLRMFECPPYVLTTSRRFQYQQESSKLVHTFWKLTLLKQMDQMLSKSMTNLTWSPDLRGSDPVRIRIIRYSEKEISNTFPDQLWSEYQIKIIRNSVLKNISDTFLNQFCSGYWIIHIYPSSSEKEFSTQLTNYQKFRGIVITLHLDVQLIAKPK